MTRSGGTRCEVTHGMWKWALLVLVASTAAAEPIPIGITVGGWRYPSGVTNLRVVSDGYTQLEPGQDMGTLDASTLVQLPSNFSVGLHATTASTLRVLGQYSSTQTDSISSALLLRPVTLAIAARYVWRPFWVMPWIGREFLHARYSIKTSDSQSSTTVRHNEWDDNGPVIGVTAGVDLLSHACFAVSMYAEIETVFDGGRDDLAYTPLIDTAFTFGFGVRYR